MREPFADLVVTDAPGDRARSVIADGLAAFNHEKTGHRDYESLAVLATEPGTNEVVGGLDGRTYLGLFVIDRIYLPERLRGRGLGSRILRMAEDAARERGCVYAAAVMVSFQAPSFFMSRGYDMAAQLYCAEKGPTHFFMTKDLSRPTERRGRIW